MFCCSVVAVFGDITDPASRQIGVDDLLNQVMLCWKQSRAAVDELLTAKFDLSDKVSDSHLNCSLMLLLCCLHA